ncbi:MAG: phosphoribosyltransferase family protein [Candidatus Izemoplasmatales bacterium]|nr:phosphoribosyltransferase family protein [Candidatus Izemoplasmatales bacterium]
MSWNEFESLSLDLAKKIKDSRKEIDIIICVSRGGLVLGKILSEVLDKPLAVISAKYMGARYTVDNKISSLYPIKGTILLVDDILEDTVYDIIDEVKKNKLVTNILLASIFYRKKKNNFKPNFVVGDIIDSLWITFPYQASCLKGKSL